MNAIATINGIAFMLSADNKSNMVMIRLLLGRNKLDFPMDRFFIRAIAFSKVNNNA
ncbi:MAG: hypothetical protein ABI359_13110 [Ginsengibacter sp.]